MLGFQCEQMADACGKKTDTEQLRDRLTGALIGLARATEGNDHMLSASTADVTVEGLVATLPGMNSDNDTLLEIISRADSEKRKLVPECYNCAASCGRTNNYDMQELWDADEDIRSLKSRILFGIRDIAAHASRTTALGYRDEAIHKFLYKALFALGRDDWGMEELLPIQWEAVEVNRKCMELLSATITTPDAERKGVPGV